MAPSPDTHLGPYEVLGPLGAGGMGEVYRARDTRLGREVAVKVLADDLADDPSALARFMAEARAVAELLEGETLRALLRRWAIPVRRALDIAGPRAKGSGLDFLF